MPDMPLRETHRRRPRSGRTHRDAHRPASPAPAPNAPFDAMLRGALLPSTAAGCSRPWSSCGSCATAAAALAALLGVAVAVVFFAAGLSVMKRVVGANPLSVLAGALAVYLGQILFLGVIILVLVRGALAGRHRLRPRHPRRRARLAGVPGGRLPADAPQRVRRPVRRRAGEPLTRPVPGVQRGRVDERLVREREELAMTDHDEVRPRRALRTTAHPGYDRVAARETVVMYNALAYVLAGPLTFGPVGLGARPAARHVLPAAARHPGRYGAFAVPRLVQVRFAVTRAGEPAPGTMTAAAAAIHRSTQQLEETL